MTNGKDARKNRGMKKTVKEHTIVWEKTEEQRELEAIRRKKASNQAIIDEMGEFDPTFRTLRKMGCTEIEAFRAVLESDPKTREIFNKELFRLVAINKRAMTKEEALRFLKKSDLITL